MNIKFWNYKAIGKESALAGVVAFPPPMLPTLSRGAHSEGSGYACIMEYISVLAGEAWSDHPKAVMEVLATAARCVNDSMEDKDRHLLVPIITRLLGTGMTKDTDRTKYRETRAAILARAREFGVSRNASQYIAGMSYSIAGIVIHDEYTMSQTLIAFEMTHPSPQKRVEFLHALIDVYDQQTGRATHDISTRRMNRAIEKVEQKSAAYSDDHDYCGHW